MTTISTDYDYRIQNGAITICCTFERIEPAPYGGIAKRHYQLVEYTTTKKVFWQDFHANMPSIYDPEATWQTFLKKHYDTLALHHAP